MDEDTKKQTVAATVMPAAHYVNAKCITIKAIGNIKIRNIIPGQRILTAPLYRHSYTLQRPNVQILPFWGCVRGPWHPLFSFPVWHVGRKLLVYHKQPGTNSPGWVDAGPWTFSLASGCCSSCGHLDHESGQRRIWLALVITTVASLEKTTHARSSSASCCQP